jgi:carbon storage regulator
MLVLTRKSDEGVVIAGDIVIRVLDVQGGRVRLGIEAPDDMFVLRAEVAARLGLYDADREASAATAAG